MTRAEQQLEWENRIAEYGASGLSAKEWCAAHDVKSHQLWYWLRKHKTTKDASSAKSNRWLPVEMGEQATAPQSNTLLLRVGPASIEVKPGFDPELLSETIHVLISLC